MPWLASDGCSAVNSAAYTGLIPKSSHHCYNAHKVKWPLREGWHITLKAQLIRAFGFNEYNTNATTQSRHFEKYQADFSA